MARTKRLKQIKKIKRIRKWKKRSLIVLFAFIFLIVFLWIFIYTSLGIKIITGALEKFVPEIRIEHATGALNDLTIEGFSLDMPGIGVKVGKAELSLSGLCLIQGKICIKNLDVDDTEVNIYTDNIETDPNAVVEENPERTLVKLPLPLELRNAELKNVAVNVNDMHFGLSYFKGNAFWSNEKIFVYSSVANDVKAIFADNPQATPVKTTEVDNRPINQVIDDIFNQPLIAQLPNVNIPLDFHVRRLEGDNWLLHMGGQDFYFDNVLIEADTVNNFIKANNVKANFRTPYSDGDAQVKGQITLGGDWPVSAEVQAKTTVINNQSTQVIAKANGKLLGTLGANAILTGTNSANVDASINFIEHYMPVTAKVNGKHIQWPIAGKADYELNNFAVDLSGSVDEYQANAKAFFKGQDLPDVQFNFSSQGTNEHIGINNAQAIFPQGELDLSGNLNWVDSLKWNANIAFKKVDLKKELPNYPVKLDGQFETAGQFSPDNWLVSLTKMQIKGDLNQLPLTASGDLVVDSSQFVSAKKFNLIWGTNRINLDGATKNNSFIADINLPNLGVIQPTMRGHIYGKINVQGSMDHPSLESDIQIDDFVWQDFILKKAELIGNANYKQQLSGNLQLKVNNFEMPSVSIKNATVELKGDELNHQLAINVDGVPASANMLVNGHLNKDRTNWAGELAQGQIIFDENNHWKLNRAAGLNYNITRSQVAIDAQCWVNQGAKICLDQNVIIAEKGEAIVSLSDIDLSIFDVFSETGLKLVGSLNGQTHIKWDPTMKIPTVSANINGKNVYIEAPQSPQVPVKLLQINANINDKQADMLWNIDLEKFGHFNGNIKVTDPTNKKQLSGQLVVDKISLAIANLFLDNEDSASGELNGKLNFSGTLMDPFIKGKIALDQTKIKTAQLPTDIESIKMDIDFLGKSSILTGVLTTASGNIDINGKADWQTVDSWNAAITVKGAALEVNLPAILTMSVVPDIRVEANPNELNLTGRVIIPKAKITVESLPASTVDVSPDEVMLDNNLKEVSAQQAGMKINTRLFISLGDDVAIDAFGLDAQLKGNLLVSQNTKGLSVNGQITVPKGRFHAYGQDLIVRRGDIIFSGPVDQPRLNIEAIRNPESIENNVTAGIRVTGLADNPKVEIFSDPAMSEQEALSYLLRGQGLDAQSQSDNDMMTALLIGLGTAQGGKFIGDVGNLFGIKNLSLDTQGVGDNQKVVVSGYILPSLQLKYSVGIFDSLATFAVRYRLLPRLYLEATSGIEQTVDLIYQFEF